MRALARPAPADGGQGRIRVIKTYADPKRHRLEGDELVFDRSLGRPANAVVLSKGWGLTNSTILVVKTASHRASSS